MPKDMYRQCHLIRGNEHQTSWIPSEIANVNQTVKLKEDDGTWDEGWQVTAVFNELPYEVVRERGQDYKKTRKASDV